MKNKLSDEITNIKQVLDVMPKNNPKNIESYRTYIKSLKSKYTDSLKIVNDTINERINSIYNKDNVIDINQKKDIIYFLSSYCTSLEKSGLDKYINGLIHFYKDDFEGINKCIEKILDIFKKFGIEINLKLFNYIPCVKEYMNVFLYNKDNLKECFDRLYWENPNIIYYIVLNIYVIYYKYEKRINKYYESNNDNKSNVMDSICINKDTLISLFLNNTYNIDNFSDSKLESDKLLLSDIDIDDLVVDKLYNSLNEYKLYLEFKYIIDDFKNVYNEKSKYKDVYKNSLKIIEKKEKKVYSLNRKYMFTKNNKKKDSIILEMNEILNSLKNDYEELELNKVREKISTLDNSFSYYDILDMILSYFIYARRLILGQNNELSEDDINNIIDNGKVDLLKQDYSLLKNISILENIDIPLVISDRYKLINFKITKEDIENNLEELINVLDRMKVKREMDKLGVTYNDIMFLEKVM